jgi:hypothetical protein
LVGIHRRILSLVDSDRDVINPGNPGRKTFSLVQRLIRVAISKFWRVYFAIDDDFGVGRFGLLDSATLPVAAN